VSSEVGSSLTSASPAAASVSRDGFSGSGQGEGSVRSLRLPRWVAAGRWGSLAWSCAQLGFRTAGLAGLGLDLDFRFRLGLRSGLAAAAGGGIAMDDCGAGGGVFIRFGRERAFGVGGLLLVPLCHFLILFPPKWLF
jgi:hypothetical protein